MEKVTIGKLFPRVNARPLGRQKATGVFYNSLPEHLYFSSNSQSANGQGNPLASISRKYPVVRQMLQMIRIPSATPQDNPQFDQTIRSNMDKVRTLITDQLHALGMNGIEQNPYGSLIVRVPGSPGLEQVQPLMLTAHMDIVAGDRSNPTRAVHPQLKTIDGVEYITSDGTTTLGADDKGGIAMILQNLERLKDRPHVPLEIIFSPDEESTCQSLKQLDTSSLKAKHVLVVDEFDPFKVTTGLASMVSMDIKISGGKGGHSGADIGDPTRLNAIVLMSELISQIGSGVLIANSPYPGLPLISKNIGEAQGGYAPNAIPPGASFAVRLRSFDKAAQQAEIERIKGLIDAMNTKIQRIDPGMKVTMETQEQYPAWQGDPNSILPQICTEAGQEMGHPNVAVGAIHAAAQASILANKKNAYGEPFDAVLIGPHILDAHTTNEKIEWRSLIEADQWLGHIIDRYTTHAAQGASTGN